MMFYAQVNPSNVVVAVTVTADPVTTQNMVPLANEDVGLIGKIYDPQTGNFNDPPPAPPAPSPVWEWYMDLGPFSDRLGAASAAIDLSTEPGVVAIRSDFSRRKWIDLKDQRVIAALWYLAGQAHPVLGTLATPLLTPAAVTTILTTPVPLKDNLALRKVYFS